MSMLNLWMTKLATLMNLGAPVLTDGRRHLRVQTNLRALISGPLGTIRVQCVDICRGGATIRATEPLAIGALVFLRMTSLGLMGFAFVRHGCAENGVYRIGLQFRDGITRERAADAAWDYQRAVPDFAWDGPEG